MLKIYPVLFVFLTFFFCHKEKDDPISEPTDPFPQETENRYIVFFLTNTSVDQAESTNTGKDANRQYSFVAEIPEIFGPLDKSKPYKYAFGLPGPMLLTQSIEQMVYMVNKAFDLAEEYDVPVYFQIDDCNNYTTEFGSGASPKFYQNPEWCEWTSFPGPNENWGGESNGRLPYFWFNWGQWMHAETFPCFDAEGFQEFVINQFTKGVLEPLKTRYSRLIQEDKEYLFAGMAVGWETHIPDYSVNNTILNVRSDNLPVNVLKGDRMQSWEAAEYGYNALNLRGEKSYNREVLFSVIHDYIELMSKTAFDYGIPRNKIFTHIVGFQSYYRDLKTTFAPPIWTAVNDYSIPGFTLSPVTAKYDLNVLLSEINVADPDQTNFANVEGYSRGVDETFEEADEYFGSMFNNGATLVTVFGWGREPATSEFAVSHSQESPFVKAAAKWLSLEGNK